MGLGYADDKNSIQAQIQDKAKLLKVSNLNLNYK